MPAITSIKELEKIYGTPSKASTMKVLDRLSQTYARFIRASPFMALASVGPEGLDCSPRGDENNVVTIADDKTLLLPDWRGNNRMDSLRNIVRDPRVSLMFMVPGSQTILRVNGRAIVTADEEFCKGFEINGKLPRSVIAIDISQAYFQCARAIKRSKIWDAASQSAALDLPTPGDMLNEISNGNFDGAAYDRDWPARAKETLW